MNLAIQCYLNSCTFPSPFMFSYWCCRCGHCDYSVFERSKIKQHHKYRHAAAGLEISIVEQQASLPEPSPSSSKAPAANDYGAVYSALEQEDAESNQDQIPTQLELDKTYQPHVRLINIRTLPEDYISLLLLKNGATKTPWFTVEGMETETEKVTAENEDDVKQPGEVEEMEAEANMEVCLY